MYTPATNAALLAQLTARAEFGQFTFVVGTTTQTPYIEHPRVHVRARGPKPWALVSWWAVYRSPSTSIPVLGNVNNVGLAVVGQDVYAGVSRQFFGPAIRGQAGGPDAVACDLTDSVVVQGLLLEYARDLFDQHDRRMQQAARPPAKFP